MRILLASPYRGSGGITRWTGHILNYYQDHHYEDVELDLLAMDRKPFSNVIMRLLCGIWDYSRILIKAYSKLHNRQYDVIHICTSGSISYLKDLFLLFMAKQQHVHTVLHLHYGRIPEIKTANNWEWKLLQKSMKYVDVCVTMNRPSYDTLITAGYKNIVNIPNPLAPEVEQFVEKEGKKSLRDERMILFAGHCLKTKGVYELVEACKNIPGIHLVLAGMIREEVKTDLETISGKDMNLEILGEVPYDDVLRLMMQCGIFVLPSYTEGFPNVILESMACGCAIIGTTVGSIPEMIEEENGKMCGLLIPPKDTEALKRAIYQLLDDIELTGKCRINAKQRVKRYNMNYVWRELVRTWKYVYKKRLSTKGNYRYYSQTNL